MQRVGRKDGQEMIPGIQLQNQVGRIGRACREDEADLVYAPDVISQQNLCLYALVYAICLGTYLRIKTLIVYLSISIIQSIPVISPSQRTPNRQVSVSRERTPAPQPTPVLPQPEHSHNAQARQPSQHTDPPSNPQINEHRPRKQHTRRRKNRPQEVVGRKKRRSVLRIRKRQIDKNALENQKIPIYQNRAPDKRYDPVHARARRPAEDKVPDGQHHDAEESRHKAVFGSPHAVALDVRDEVVDLVEEEGGDAADAGDADGDEGHSCQAEGEVVDALVD